VLQVVRIDCIVDDAILVQFIVPDFYSAGELRAFGIVSAIL
jgi:hypothetical protein